MDIILFGPPGAGKGTQAAAIAERARVPHISTGDIFRKNLREGTELGKLAKGYMDRGELVPDSVVCDLVTDRLTHADAVAGSLLDGFPRTVMQAELLLDWLEAQGRTVGAVINLQVDDDVLVRRLSGRRTCSACGASYHVDHNPPSVAGVCDECGSAVVQRADDSEETVAARLATYHDQTAAVLPVLRRRATVSDIDGNQAIDRVKAAVLAVIDAADG
ncbi:MAG: adenylate kinase [Alphaproteobacteria bacterium]|nr:adenylate kinase [Alphaproteobacteria bacterium]